MEPSWHGLGRNRPHYGPEPGLLAGGFQDFIRRENSDAAEPAKVLGIERQQIRNSMHAHRCHYASVMDLNTRDARRNYDPPPLLMRCFAVGGKRKLGFDQSSAFIRLCNRESEPVPVNPLRTMNPFAAPVHMIESH